GVCKERILFRGQRLAFGDSERWNPVRIAPVTDVRVVDKPAQIAPAANRVDVDHFLISYFNEVSFHPCATRSRSLSRISSTSPRFACCATWPLIAVWWSLPAGSRCAPQSSPSGALADASSANGRRTATFSRGTTCAGGCSSSHRPV